MSKQNFNDLLDRLRLAQREMDSYLDALIQEKRKEFNFRLEHGKAVFEGKVETLLKERKVGTLAYVKTAPIGYILSTPIIYGMIIPLLFLDIFITLYQQICFRIYEIPLVNRKDYIVIDRHRLPYLNTIQKLNCVYCGYGNGLIAYAREIIARTEQFWCPIRHTKRAKDPHHRTEKFLDYGDAESWDEQLVSIRKDWR